MTLPHFIICMALIIWGIFGVLYCGLFGPKIKQQWKRLLFAFICGPGVWAVICLVLLWRFHRIMLQWFEK